MHDCVSGPKSYTFASTHVVHENQTYIQNSNTFLLLYPTNDDIAQAMVYSYELTCFIDCSQRSLIYRRRYQNSNVRLQVILSWEMENMASQLSQVIILYEERTLKYKFENLKNVAPRNRGFYNLSIIIERNSFSSQTVRGVEVFLKKILVWTTPRVPLGRA